PQEDISAWMPHRWGPTGGAPLHMTYMLGKLPPKRPYAAVRIKLRDYLVLPAPPKYRGWAQGVNFRMYLNDTLGDCAVASIGHIAQTHTRRDGHEVDPMDDQ